MSAETATVLAAALSASLLTLLGSFLVADFQAKRTVEAARVADARSLRDAKRERLRGDYVPVAYAADAILSASKQLGVLWAGDTIEDRNARLETQLADATDDLRLAVIHLRLETDTQSIIDAYERVRGHWFQLEWQVPEADRQHDHSQVLATLTALEADVEGIIILARSQLHDMGKPI